MKTNIPPHGNMICLDADVALALRGFTAKDRLQFHDAICDWVLDEGKEPTGLPRLLKGMFDRWKEYQMRMVAHAIKQQERGKKAARMRWEKARAQPMETSNA